MLAFAYLIELMAVFSLMGRYEPEFCRGLFMRFTHLIVPD